MEVCPRRESGLDRDGPRPGPATLAVKQSGTAQLLPDLPAGNQDALSVVLSLLRPAVRPEPNQHVAKLHPLSIADSSRALRHPCRPFADEPRPPQQRTHSMLQDRRPSICSDNARRWRHCAGGGSVWAWALDLGSRPSVLSRLVCRLGAAQRQSLGHTILTLSSPTVVSHFHPMSA